MNEQVNEQNRTQSRKKSNYRNVMIFVIIIIGVVIVSILLKSIFTSESETYTIPNSEYIAVMEVNGEIGPSSGDSSFLSQSTSGYNHDWTIERIEELIADKNNKGLLMQVDTPGGTVYESDELFLKLKEYQEKTGRPYYVYMKSMAASGGYYISAPADKIYANRNTWTGSIGVTMGTFVDISEFLKDRGIKTTTITAGENKAMGSYFDPMTSQQKKLFQSLIDEAYEQFTEIVSEGRNLSIEEILKIADGRIYTAKQAKKIGLVDEIGTFKEAVSSMKTDYALDNVELVDIIYQAKTSFLDSLFMRFEESLSALNPVQSSEIDSVMKAAEVHNLEPIKYLYEGR